MRSLELIERMGDAIEAAMPLVALALAVLIGWGCM